MKYIEWNIDPVVFRVADIPVMYYSLLLIAGTVLSVWMLKRVYKENGMPWEHLQILVMLSIAGLFLGARLGHCLVYEYSYYIIHPLEILLPIRVQPDGEVVFFSLTNSIDSLPVMCSMSISTISRWLKSLSISASQPGSP